MKSTVSTFHFNSLFLFTIFAAIPSLKKCAHPTSSKGVRELVTMQARLVDGNDQSSYYDNGDQRIPLLVSQNLTVQEVLYWQVPCRILPLLIPT